MNIKDMEDYLNHGAVQEEKYAECVKNNMQFRNLVFQAQLIQSGYSKAKDAQQINKVKSILASPLLSSPSRALSFASLRDYYITHMFCDQLLDKWDHAIQLQREWVTYLESDKTNFIERSNIYLLALVNLMIIQFKNNRMDETEKLYEKIKHSYFSLPPKKRTRSLLELWIGGSANYMNMHIQKGNPEKVLEVWEQMKEYVSVNKLNPNIFPIICDSLSCSYFMLHNFHNALKWANKILNFRNKNALDQQAMSRVYVLLIHYELGNYDMLPYMAKAAHRFLIKYNFLTEFEKSVIGFFEKEIHKVNDRREQTEAFRALRVRLETLLKGAKQILALEHFDYMSWIESKIENRSFIEVVKEKAKK